MSELAHKEFVAAKDEQAAKNDARRIYQRVEAAQQRPSRAGVRWPFELMQNAHDAGPRDGDERVEIDFTLYDDRLVVSHTGKPFLVRDLAALLSGGSSKEFDSEETTGRFGTGFLVTHALSTQVDVNGVLITQEDYKNFHIKLVRDGDENSIVKNIEQANEALENAKSISVNDITNDSTASFVYHDVNDGVAQRGLSRLEQTLPYLYATCNKLGSVRIEQFKDELLFKPEAQSEKTKGDFVINEIHLTITSSDAMRNVVASRVGRKDGQSALLTILECRGPGEYHALLPSEDFSRVFVTFPIAGTSFLPFNVVLDGNFSPDQERDGIAMGDGDKTLVDEALSALPALVQYAVESDWLGAHNLAYLSPPDRPLSGENESGELAWWHDVVLRVAKETAAMSIVQTESGLLPAAHNQDGLAASFLVPAIDANATECVDYDIAYEIANAITDLNLPSKEVAQSWGEVARQWADIGVSVERLGLKELTDWLKERADSIDKLPVQGDRFAWLARLFLLAAEMNDLNVRDMVNGLLPDQYGNFHSTKSDYLYSDAGIPPKVKDIADAVGEDLREQLLHNEMASALKDPGYEAANDLIKELLDSFDGDAYTEDQAINVLLDTLEKKFPDNSQFEEDTGFDALCASARLISHLAESDDAPRIRRCPLLTAAGTVTYLSGNQQILAPKQHWPESAQPYAGLYTERRLLSDRYCDDDYLAQALDDLIPMRLVIAAPLFEGRRAEIEDVNLLREMSSGDTDIARITVRDASFGQIAFLATDLVQRCGQDAELAELLLDFVLNVAAPEDQSWRKVETVAGSRSGETVALSLYGATWPFELKVRSWIPVERPDEEGIVPMPANESNLRSILNVSWLRNNRDAQELLHRFFGFQKLNLVLDTLDDETKRNLTELLQYPELVAAASANPDAVKFASELDSRSIELDTVREFVQDIENDEGLVEFLAERRRQLQTVRHNQYLGDQVEDFVSANLQDAGFSVIRTGVGSDFRIAAELGHIANLELILGDESWFVEVKATRDQPSVRMTDIQAKTAVSKGDHFLLCVVSVGSENERLEASEVRASMRFVTGMGSRLASLCDNLGEFEEHRDYITGAASSGVQLEVQPGPVRIRVASSVWENGGFSIDELAGRLSSQ